MSRTFFYKETPDRINRQLPMKIEGSEPFSLARFSSSLDILNRFGE